MSKYYIPHKLKVGDTTNLADQDSKFAIESGVKINDEIQVETQEKIFNAQVKNITPNCVEILVKEETLLKKEIQNNTEIILIQSLTDAKKFELIVEKSVELGISRLSSIHSEYSTEGLSKMRKMQGRWQQIISKAMEQSRNPKGLQYVNPQEIENLEKILPENSLRICLTTETIESFKFSDLAKQLSSHSKIVIAVGPEKGWSMSDLNIFKQNNFKFLTLKGNILRAETSSIVITSLIKLLRNEF